jgi:hypothetical protein
MVIVYNTGAEMEHVDTYLTTHHLQPHTQMTSTQKHYPIGLTTDIC